MLSNCLQRLHAVVRHHLAGLGEAVAGPVEIGEFELETEATPGGFQHAHALRQNFLADSVSRNERDLVLGHVFPLCASKRRILNGHSGASPARKRHDLRPQDHGRHHRRRHRQGRASSGDLGIKDGKVVALGKADGAAATTIDATGKVVSPGFVDVHTHYDAQILWDRMLSISPWHGVTTTVIGNCGFGVAPTKAIHRKLIMQTLEKVEGMSLDALAGGPGRGLAVRDLPAVSRRAREARLGDQRRGPVRPHAAAPVRHGRGIDRARGHAGRDQRR